MTQAEKEQDSGKEKEKERDKEKEKEQQRGVKRPIAPPVIPDPLQEVSCFPVRGFSGPETDSEQASVLDSSCAGSGIPAASFTRCVRNLQPAEAVIAQFQAFHLYDF